MHKIQLSFTFYPIDLNTWQFHTINKSLPTIVSIEPHSRQTFEFIALLYQTFTLTLYLFLLLCLSISYHSPLSLYALILYRFLFIFFFTFPFPIDFPNFFCTFSISLIIVFGECFIEFSGSFSNSFKIRPLISNWFF